MTMRLTAKQDPMPTAGYAEARINVAQPSGPRVLIIVQNLPVPLDRRVWLECLALKANGYLRKPITLSDF